MSDNINHPEHYNQNGIECIDVIAAALGAEGLKAFCVGNALKYIYRHEHKGKPEEDIKKAIWYLNKWLDVSRETTDNYPVKCSCGLYPTYGSGGDLYFVECSKCKKAVYRQNLQEAIQTWNRLQMGCPFDESGEVNNENN